MLDVVGDVSKESPPRLQLIDILERLINPQMCWMFSETQTIEYEHVQTLQRVDRRRRNLAEIRQVSKVVKTISHHRQATMNHFQRRDLQLVPNTKTRTVRDNVCEHFGQTATVVRRLEDVLEDAFDIHPRAFIRVDPERAKTKVQRPNVVKTKNVIGVTMRDEHGVEMLQPEAQRLLSKVGRRIDEKRAAAVLDDD